MKRSRVSNRSDTKEANSSKLFARTDIPTSEVRLHTYRITWGEIESKSKEIISESHRQLLDDINTFINLNASSGGSSIPTALVALGVNLPDHSAFFSLLDLTLKKSSSPHIAMLSSKECPSLKHMVQKTIQKLVIFGTADDEQDADDTLEDNDEVKTILKPNKYKTFSHLVSWYKEMGQNKPLIIVLQDLESFSNQQLQDYVLLCREYRVRCGLPLFFIMGLATTTALQQQLHHRTSVCLATKSFQTKPSVGLLNQLIGKLFMDESVLKIGPRLIQVLLDGFLYHDLSLNSFLHRIHLIVMQHFITLPVSILCCPISQIPGKINLLSSADLDLFRQLPSFMKLIESNRSKVSLLTDDKQFRQFLLKSLQELVEYSVKFSTHCKMVHSFSQGLPDALFGKTLREVYVTFLTNGGSDDWDQFLRLIGLCSAHELRSRIEASLDVLKEMTNSGGSLLLSFRTSLICFLEEINRLEAENVEEIVSAKSQNLFAPQEGKKMDKFELRARLLATARQARPTSKFDEIRSEVVTWLNTDFVANLKSPSSMIFHEIFYAGSQVQSNWDIVPWIRRQIQPVPRVAISKALTNPSAYLGCKCCSNSEESLPTTLPDICIAYKLHTECGRLVNLYDWMVSFNCVLKKDEEEESEEIEPIVQARFIRAVAQLQLLGFVQSSKRKTDHVARLTWGI